MEDLYSIIDPQQIRKYVNTDKLSSEMCLHLAQDLYFLVDKLNDYHFGKLKLRDYKRYFRGDEDLNQMWDNAKSAISRIRSQDPSLLTKVPEAFLQGGRFFDHPSTWKK